MSSRGALVVIGSGPGIGRATAVKFAKHGFTNIILLSRTKSKLSEDASAITSAVKDAKVEIQEIDMSADEATVRQVLAEVDGKLKTAGVPLEVVLYNAARVAPSQIPEFEAKEFETDLKITTVNLYVTLQWAVPKLLETSKSGSYNPAFLTTSGALYREPFHFLFSLSAAKAAQHNLITSFHGKYEPEIHFALVAIRGVVGDDAKVTTPSAVAEQFYELYEQKKGTKGKVSVELNDPDYEDAVEGMRKSIEGS